MVVLLIIFKIIPYYMILAMVVIGAKSFEDHSLNVMNMMIVFKS